MFTVGSSFSPMGTCVVYTTIYGVSIIFDKEIGYEKIDSDFQPCCWLSINETNLLIQTQLKKIHTATIDLSFTCSKVLLPVLLYFIKRNIWYPTVISTQFIAMMDPST